MAKKVTKHKKQPYRTPMAFVGQMSQEFLCIDHLLTSFFRYKKLFDITDAQRDLNIRCSVVAAIASIRDAREELRGYEPYIDQKSAKHFFGDRDAGKEWPLLTTKTLTVKQMNSFIALLQQNAESEDNDWDGDDEDEE